MILTLKKMALASSFTTIEQRKESSRKYLKENSLKIRITYYTKEKSTKQNKQLLDKMKILLFCCSWYLS